MHTSNPSRKEFKVERTSSLAASLSYVKYGYIVGLPLKKRKERNSKVDLVRHIYNLSIQ